MHLRRAVEADLEDLLGLDNDPDVMRWLNGGLPIELVTFRQRYLPNFLNAQPEPFGFWLIVLRQHDQADQFVGWVSLRPVDCEVISADNGLPEATLGYRLAKSFWGQGIATRACEALLGKIEPGTLGSISATTYEENIASQRVLEKLGFTLARRYQPTLAEVQSVGTSEVTDEIWPGDEFEYRRLLSPGLAI